MSICKEEEAKGIHGAETEEFDDELDRARLHRLVADVYVT